MLRMALAAFLAATPALAQSDLVAIDVLLEPDATMVAAAEAWNAGCANNRPTASNWTPCTGPTSRFCSNTSPRPTLRPCSLR